MGCCSSDIPEAPVQRLVSSGGDTKSTHTSQLFNPKTATPFECAEFERFCQHFSVPARYTDPENMLRTQPTLALLYNEHVPSRLSNEEFWQRYYFKVEGGKKSN
mmetsp:Transcript_21730/g.39051  ORF Transcript_21730/g.39051 Transcript_21730/m.39051 type:complete len:104 (-) Transcript_21730:325-636(-)